MFPVSNNKKQAVTAATLGYTSTQKPPGKVKRGGEKNIFGKQKRQFQGDKTWHYGNACFKLQGSIKIKMKKEKQKKKCGSWLLQTQHSIFFFKYNFSPQREVCECVLCADWNCPEWKALKQGHDVFITLNQVLILYTESGRSQHMRSAFNYAKTWRWLLSLCSQSCNSHCTGVPAIIPLWF